MTGTQTKRYTKEELQESRLCVLVHAVTMRTTVKELEHLIKEQIGLPTPQINFGKPYNLDGEQRQKAYLNFKNEDRVNQLMKSRVLTHQGQELRLSRYNPKNCHMSGHITCAILLTIHTTKEENGFEKELTEYHLKKHFKIFGRIVNCHYQSSQKVILEFEDYDSVDQIILHDVYHTINDIRVDVEKTANFTSAALPYCVHVSNIPCGVTSDELSAIFSVHVADILLRPADPSNCHLASRDRSTSEVWIKHLSNRQALEDFAKKYSRITIHESEVYYKVVQEPFSISELCRDFEQGVCKYPSGQCNYKHFMYNEPDEREDNECWSGHSRTRATLSNGRPVEDTAQSRYRVRISNIPSTTTKEQLLNRLNISPKYIERVKFPDQSGLAEPIVAYLTNQPSENFIRRKIREWHNSRFSPNVLNTIKCQLEWNINYFDWDDDDWDSSEASSSASNRSSSIPRITTKVAPWCKGNKDAILTSSQTVHLNGTSLKSVETNKSTRKKATLNDQEPSDMAARTPQWRWTGEKLSNDSLKTVDVYLLQHKTNKELRAAIKVYRTARNQMARQTAQCERIILETLKGLDGIPKFLTSNIDVQSGFGSKNDPWIIMEHIEGVRLLEFVKNNSLTFEKKLLITSKFLDLVHKMHSQNVVHRHIDPENIIIRTPQDNLALIGFSRASFIEDDGSKDTTVFEDDRKYTLDTFYQTPQFERQSPTDSDNDNSQRRKLLCSPSIDITYVCAVLFWLITGHYPKESRNIHGEAPHELKVHSNAIDEEVTKTTGVWTKTEQRAALNLHLRLIFDRGFAAPDQQWPVEELSYQLQHVLQLATKNNKNNVYFPSSLSKKQVESSLSTSKPSSFLQLASLIDSMKRHFSIRYPDISWSTDNKSQWTGHSENVQNTDFLTFKKQQRSIVIETCCRVWINKNQELAMTIMAKLNQNNKVTLPLGVWKQYEEENIKKEILDIFELELKILVNIFHSQTIA